MKKPIRRILVANRGEIAVRVMATAAEMNVATVAVYSDDDRTSLHVKRADEAILLDGSGASAYLDIEQIVAAASRSGCDAIHPGYGFLSESEELARRCEAANLIFIGPAPDTLVRLGDKAQARALAVANGVPVARGTSAPLDDQTAREFLASLGAGARIAIKAVAGGGGRGIRIVGDKAELGEALERCRSEALSSFGRGDVYAEEFLAGARHIEVQIIGDGTGRVMHLGERECSIQRQKQKMIEIAPAPALAPPLREAIAAAALKLAAAVRYRNIGTFEFLVRDNPTGDAERDFVFMEVNPRIQVEHTVTEMLSGVDLVRVQIQIASGMTLDEAGLGRPVTHLAGFAIQARVNAEQCLADGSVRPAAGRLARFDVPVGPGIRVDTAGYAGYSPSARFDSLLAKLIVHSRSERFEDAAIKASRALRSFNIGGIQTNIDLLLRVLEHPAFVAADFDTQFIEQNLQSLLGSAPSRSRLYFETEVSAVGRPGDDEVREAPPPGTEAVLSPLVGTVLAVGVESGQQIAEGQTLVVIEAMKMEHVVPMSFSGIVRRIAVQPGDTVAEGDPLAFVERADVDIVFDSDAALEDPSAIRPDLAKVLERRALWLDEARPAMVEKRHAQGRRTARENVADLCDPGSFKEYFGFAIAAQRARRSLDDLIRNTPADGQVCGVGTVNGQQFGDDRAQCAVLAYDYSVFAGTQGHNNHEKTDRMLELARDSRLPVVFFAEGGGGRPGDTEGSWVGQPTFNLLPSLSGLVPMIGIVSGYCFAGNAAVFGMCDVTIATRKSNIGMGGPAMIEAGGLGRFRSEEIGPTHELVKAGVIDILVENEAEAVAAAKRYLAFWQGRTGDWHCADQTALRGVIPLDRRRMYEVRKLVELLADTGSIQELRRGFAPSMYTAFARIEGHPIGILANDPAHLAGAIDSDAADKGARFMRLCESYGLPLLSLIDTPGIMVGPDAERTGIVRHSARLFLTAASLSVPHMAVVTRKGYGLGKLGMTSGSFRATRMAVAWPTAEFGAMNLEGGIRLSHRKELAAIEDPAEREQTYRRLVEEAYEAGSALSRATDMEIDDVIDPAETRGWIAMGLRGFARRRPEGGSAPAFIDSW